MERRVSTPPALLLARSRGILIILAAVILPIGFMIVMHMTHYDAVRHVLFVIPMLAVIVSAAFARLIPFLRRIPVTATVARGAYMGTTIWILAILHPLEYVAMNSLAGGTHGAHGRFELDYWAAAATEALRRLESRLDHEPRDQSAAAPPSLFMCITARDTMATPMFGRPWRIEVDAKKADFIIETERWRCVDKAPAVLIDVVKRFDRPFAWIYAHRSLASD